MPEASAPREAEWLLFMLIIWRGGLSELVHVGAIRTQSLMFTMADERIYGLPSVPLDGPQGKPLCLCPGLQASRD